MSLTWTRLLSLFHMIQKNIEVVGRRTIHIRKSTSDTKCATCALTVTASGKMITPLFVFKGKNIQLIVGMMKCFSHFIVLLLGKPNGMIVQREFPTYPEGMIYACQDNAWMDKRVMQMWVNMVLKPYVDTAPENVVSAALFGFVLLSHDEFSCKCNPGPWGCSRAYSGGLYLTLPTC